jgi:hypothetical protein
MRKLLVCAVAFLFVAGAVSTAAADEIRVNSGVATIGPGLAGPGPIVLSGEDGFTLTGSLGSSGRLDARANCFPCTAGQAISTDGSFSGLDLFVTGLTVNGVSYTDVNSMSSLSAVLVSFDGPTIAAPPVVGTTAVLTMPFTLGGLLFLVSDPQAMPLQHTIAGSGLASLALRRVASDALWQFDGMQYRIEASPAPVPEPGSLLLLGTGLGAILSFARRRTRFLR